MKNTCIVFALEKESSNLFEMENVLYTGVGKVQATTVLTEYILKNNPSHIINLGTAGSTKFPRGEIVNPTAFIQRDTEQIISKTVCLLSPNTP